MNITDAMVESALEAFLKSMSWGAASINQDRLRQHLRAALEAAMRVAAEETQGGIV